jgi:4-diphosphocytidyl-2-C-methyl-D-erythritol kinase
MNSVGTVAHAKINLGLEVLYKRPDDFHEINTVFVRVSLADTLLIAANGTSNSAMNSITLDCQPDLGISDEENLAYKAAKKAQTLALESGAPPLPSLFITLRKQIPYGGGLGGGSSNAGAILRSLTSLWGEKTLSHEQLLTVAAEIGSDVPFFMEDMVCAFGSGRGEVLKPVEMRLPYYVVIVAPSIRILTAWAYNALKRGDKATEKRKATNYTDLLSDAIDSPNILRQHFTNDFEEVVFAEHPVLAGIKAQLYEQGAMFALMSGSGSSVFGLFKSEMQANTVCASIRERFEGSTAFVCKPL